VRLSLYEALLFEGPALATLSSNGAENGTLDTPEPVQDSSSSLSFWVCTEPLMCPRLRGQGSVWGGGVEGVPMCGPRTDGSGERSSLLSLPDSLPPLHGAVELRSLGFRAWTWPSFIIRKVYLSRNRHIQQFVSLSYNF
jgi:hypothetical protein